ncbi:hypothetical protein CVT25_014663 [Psilocybe cyanescens]|uniref:RING-type domain-containing protein n=1 Tax=Psilocybe cyanescens TaxID=93625 RepID=A0A409WU74_PSICY|nr:hypothetical protein CVT25_014663 [Psilocybe cyanescens]
MYWHFTSQSNSSRRPDNITHYKPNWISSRKRTIPPPLTLLESIDEDSVSEASEYYLNLGAETPCSTPPNLFETTEFVERWAAAGIAVPKLVRRPSYRTVISAGGKDHQRSSIFKDEVDRDCGICFEYAVDPLRTYCCGKIFCKEHLEDWLHGPNAEGRCPNCENACSLEGGTLSLATPTLLPSSISRSPQISHAPKGKQHSNAIPLCYYSSSLLSYLKLNPNDNLKTDESWGKPCGGALGCTCSPSPSTRVPSYAEYKTSAVGSSPSSTVSGAASDVTTSSSSTSTTRTRTRAVRADKTRSSSSNTKLETLTGSNLAASTTPYATSWGAMGRLMSTATFLMFLYKLLS